MEARPLKATCMSNRTKKSVTGQFPPGWELNILGALTFEPSEDGHLAVLDIGHATGETLSFPAVALDTYSTCRRELLKRYAARLVLWDVEEARNTREARQAWLELVNQAIERGRTP